MRSELLACFNIYRLPTKNFSYNHRIFTLTHYTCMYICVTETCRLYHDRCNHVQLSEAIMEVYLVVAGL